MYKCHASRWVPIAIGIQSQFLYSYVPDSYRDVILLKLGPDESVIPVGSVRFTEFPTQYAYGLTVKSFSASGSTLVHLGKW